MILMFLSLIYAGNRSATIKDIALLPFPAQKVYYRGVIEKDPLKAMRFYEKVLSKYPDSPWADSSLYRIGMYYYTMQDINQTIHFLKLILKRHPESPMKPLCNFWLGTIYLLKGDTATASSYLKNTPPSSEGGILSRIDIKNIEGENSKEVYAVQVGAYRELKWAEHRLDEMLKKGYSAEIHPIHKEDGSVIYKITIGRFNTHEEALGLMKKLKEKEHIDCWITKIWVR